MGPKENDIGEWNEFWLNYNNSLKKVSLQDYYDLCPTPYRSESIGIADLGKFLIQVKPFGVKPFLQNLFI